MNFKAIFLLSLLTPSICLASDGVGVVRDENLNAVAKPGVYVCSVRYNNASYVIGQAILAIGSEYPLPMAYQLFHDDKPVGKLISSPGMIFDTSSPSPSPLGTSYAYRQPRKGFPVEKLNMIFIDPVNGLSASIYEEKNGKAIKDLMLKECKEK